MPFFFPCSSTSTERVPRIYHAIGGTGSIPYTVFANSRANPTYRLNYHNDTTAVKFISQHCGARVALVYGCLSAPANRADLFRFCALYAMGGVYMDADLLLVHRMESVYSPCARVSLGHDFPQRSNTEAKQMKIIAGAPRQQLFRCMLLRIMRHVWQRVKPNNPLMVSGPGLLQRCYKQMNASDIAITYMDTRNARWPYTGMRTHSRLLAFEAPNILRHWMEKDPENYDSKFHQNEIYTSDCALDPPTTFCKDPFSYVDGSWVPHVAPNRTELPCCGWDRGHWRHDGRCGRSPFPHDATFTGSGDHIVHVGHLGCSDCENAKSASGFEWIPSGCRLRPLDATRLCAQSILFIGDSIQSQLASVFMMYAWTALSPEQRVRCMPNFRYVHSDTLVNRSFGHMNRGRPWSDAVRMFRPDVAVVAAGAHITTVSAYNDMLSQFVQQRHLFLSEMPQLRVIWRGTLPGGCARLGRPPRTAYNWHLFDRFDTLAKQMSQSNNATYMDMFPFRSRVDMHTRDCLHLCVPGALTIFPLILQHLL